MIMRATSKSTLHQLIFFMSNYRGKFLNVVVQAEDGASEQESLRDIHQGTARDIINVQNLDICKRDAADYEQHRASMRDNLFSHVCSYLLRVGVVDVVWPYIKWSDIGS